jgi:hypothetical protein
MRRLILASTLMASTLMASTLLLGACATHQQQPVAEAPVTQQQPVQRDLSLLVGLTAQVLVGHFGNPALQVREGNSLKLQFRSSRCTLDAYLYPQSGTLKVAHVDTRTVSGSRADQASCIATLEQRS